MMSTFFIGHDGFIDFIVSVTGLALIIPALFWLFFGELINTNQHDGENKSVGFTAKLLFWLIVIPLGILIAPGTSFIIQKMIGAQPYMNTMIALPTALVVCYSFIHLANRFDLNGKNRIIAVVCLSTLIMISGSIPLSIHPLGIKLLSNPMKIDSEVYAIEKIVDSDFVMLPEEIYGQIGEYDSGINASSLQGIPYDRYYAYHVTVTALDAKAPLFVIRKPYDNPSAIKPYYKKTAETEHYVIYQRSE